jgi:hypothetical protein
MVFVQCKNALLCHKWVGGNTCTFHPQHDSCTYQSTALGHSCQHMGSCVTCWNTIHFTIHLLRSCHNIVLYKASSHFMYILQDLSGMSYEQVSDSQWLWRYGYLKCSWTSTSYLWKNSIVQYSTLNKLEKTTLHSILYTDQSGKEDYTVQKSTMNKLEKKKITLYSVCNK